MYTLSVETRSRTQFINLDNQIRRFLLESGLKNGLLHLHIPHTTAGITINENADPDVVHDIIMSLEKMVPWNAPEFCHTEGNSAAHTKASLMGSGLTLIIRDGTPCLGTWQSVFFCEFDGPRHRSVWLLPMPIPPM